MSNLSTLAWKPTEKIRVLLNLTEGAHLVVVLCALACFLVLRSITSDGQIPKGARLPPGPPGNVIFGNALDMPRHHERVTFMRWAKQYGDLVYVKVFGHSIVFVNSADVACDLFEKRSSLYSDRLGSHTVNEWMGFGWSFVTMHYGEWWRRHRKMFHRKFHRTAVATYLKVQATQTRSLLRRLHQSPDHFGEHIRHLAGATIMEITYGIKVLPKGDPYVEVAEKVGAAGGELRNPVVFLVDVLPFLKYVPGWMPGAGFQKKARKTRTLNAQLREAPFMAVKKSLSDGTAQPSIMASLLEELALHTDAPSDEEDVIRNVTALAYLGGVETIWSALNSFVLAMVLYPEVQRKAQAELDSVIGLNRLPNFDDRKSLPYINALCKEVLRWHPSLPLAFPHRVLHDDLYGDYFIPGGSVIIGNAWAILHNEQLYGPEPEEFRPERFLKPDVKFPIAAFGFGRRICPGRHFADNAIFIAVASILKVFAIGHARDKNGKEIAVKPSFTSGLTSHPEPFQCSTRLRFVSAERLFSENDGN